MKLSSRLTALFLALGCSASFAQDITPEVPATPPNADDDVTVELVYLGLSKGVTDRITAQAYLGYGYDDDLGLVVGDIGWSLNKYISVNARYQYFGVDGSDDQHSAWAYLNAQKMFGSSWRFDTRQVIEQRFNTSGVNERTRYRPRFRASYLGTVGERGYQVYAAVEPILNLTDDNDNQTSWSGGGYLQLTESLQLNTFYQFTKTERGPDIHFPGVGILATF